MFLSAEVRWFHAGPTPPAVLAWFQGAAGEPALQARRVDAYLPLPGIDSLGIKLREGRIEVKQRLRAYGLFHPHPRVAGWLEGWRKWSFGLAAAGGGGTVLPLLAPSWIAVEKTRRLRRYRVEDRGAVAPMSADAYPERGCDWELTAIRATNGTWWSLSLVVDHILSVTEPQTLQEDDSRGYPDWLARVAFEE
jgi:hypothetical protein